MKSSHKNNYLSKKSVNKTGFKTPANYFDEVENNIINQVHTTKLSKKEGFIIPKNYFNQLENSVLEKTILLKKNPKTIIFFRKKAYIVSAIAASILLFFTVFSFYLKGNNEALKDISIEEISFWIANDYENVSTDDLAFIVDTFSDLEEINTFDFNDDEFLKNIDTYTLLNELN